jgi:hypothetical protein
LCAGSAACFDTAADRRAFDRALRTEVSPAALEALGRTLATDGDDR